MRLFVRRSVVLSAICIAVLGLGAGPAAAQTGGDVERVYTGGPSPVLGGQLTGPTGGVTTPTGGLTGPTGGLTGPTGGVANPTAGLSNPTGGGVLGAAGQRPGQVLASQVSGGTRAAQAPVQRLALTGSDVLTLVVAGFAAVGVGAVLIRRGRPRTAPTP